MVVEAETSKLSPMVLKSIPQRPSVSVLITCYNYGAYVGEAIESVLGQTYPAAEIIVGDDASQDNSCEVVESYVSRGLGVRLLRNPHGGMAANLNSAYRNCSGDVICLLDADDTFLPGKIEAVVNAFRAHPQAGFAIHRARMWTTKSGPRPLSVIERPPLGGLRTDHLRQLRVLRDLPPTSNLALRREVAERIFPIPVEYTGYAEQMIHRLAPLMTELCAVEAPLATWRLHGKNDQNSTRITSRRMERELKIMDSLWLEQKHYLERIDTALARIISRSRPQSDVSQNELHAASAEQRPCDGSGIRRSLPLWPAGEFESG